MLIDRVEMHLGRFELLIKTEIPSGYVGAGDLRIHRHAIKVVGGNEAVGGNAPEASAKSIAAAADAIPQVLVSTEEGRFPELAKPEHVKLALNTDLEVVAVVLGRALVIEDASIHGVRVVLLGSAVFTVEEQAGRHVLDGERSGPLLDVALEEGLVARGRREGSAGNAAATGLNALVTEILVGEAAADLPGLPFLGRLVADAGAPNIVLVIAPGNAEA